MTTKFDPGDKAWAVFYESKQINVPCGFCGGARNKKFAIAANGKTEEVRCPKCHGDGYIVDWTDTLSVDQVFIEEITLKKEDRSKDVYVNYKVCVGHEEGVLSYRTEDQLFRTKEDAEAAAASEE